MVKDLLWENYALGVRKLSLDNMKALLLKAIKENANDIC